MNNLEQYDCDHFVVGTRDSFQPFEYDLRRVREYMQATGKAFIDLTEAELEPFRINKQTA